MKNKLLKKLLIGGMVLSLLSLTSFSTYAAKSGTDAVDESEQEKIYEEASALVSEKYDYEKAIELLKKIEDYKDSKELIERYEKMQTNRFIDGRFYWFPEEYIQVLKQNLQTLEDDYNNIELTGGQTTPEEGTTYTLTISYDAGETNVLLHDINFDDNGNPDSFDKIEIQGTQGALIAYPAITVVATLRGDSTIDTAKEITTKMLNLNPHGEFVQDNFKYIFNNDGTTFSFLIEPVESEVESSKETTSSNNIGVDLETFITRYNAGVDYYNAIADRDGYNKTAYISADNLGGEDFSPSGNMKITVNPNTTNKSPIGIINVWADNRNNLDANISTGEVMAMLYAFDTQMKDCAEALDLWGQLNENAKVTKDGITFDNYSVDDMVAIKAQYDGFEISN